MRRIALISVLLLLLLLLPGMASATDWQELSGDAIRSSLEERKLIYEAGAWQLFLASGRTLYNQGQDSSGFWRVQNNQYCSMWPPSDLWVCYDVQISGFRIMFTDNNGNKTEGRYGD